MNALDSHDKNRKWIVSEWVHLSHTTHSSCSYVRLWKEKLKKCGKINSKCAFDVVCILLTLWNTRKYEISKRNLQRERERDWKGQKSEAIYFQTLIYEKKRNIRRPVQKNIISSLVYWLFSGLQFLSFLLDSMVCSLECKTVTRIDVL